MADTATHIDFSDATEHRRLFHLEDGCVFMNHGSFGATPRPVLDAQKVWREKMERQPVRFMTRESGPALRNAADEVAQFVGANGQDIVFTDNATAGINCVMRSIHWNRGDSILVTNHCYGGVRRVVEYVRDRYGVEIVEAAIPFPIESNEAVEQAVIDALDAQDKPIRLALLEHVSSPTAAIFPIERLTRICHEHGAQVLVDGAHAAGSVEIDIVRIAPDYYATNAHKWLFAPKTCGILWVDRTLQKTIQPPVISWGYADSLSDKFDWPGTRDFSPWLCVTDAIAFWRRMGGVELQQRNHALALEAGDILCDAWNAALPVNPTMLASMVTVPLPIESLPNDLEVTRPNAQRVHDALGKFGIEVPVVPFAGRFCVRASAQIYNQPSDYVALAEAVREMSIERA